MRRAGLLRFVLFGATGFGIGGAIAGASWPLLPFTFGASGLLVIPAGAVGGASLGLAMRDRRKIIALALLGALGFTVGSFVALIVAFVGLVPSSESGAIEGMGAGAAGVLGGAVGGASLGLAFWDWRRISILTLAGAVGLGVGLIAQFFLRETLEVGMTAGDLLLSAAGVIGGASLGAALGYLEWAAQRPPRETLLPLVAPASVALTGGLFVLFFVLPYMSICGEEERAAFSEFPQYGGIEKEPEADPLGSGCVASYETPAPPEEVAAYLSEKLKAHGWTVEHQLRAEGDGSEQFEGELVMARRDGFTYNAGYESLEFYEPPRPGTYVVVRLRKEE